MLGITLTGCSNFDELNLDQTAASAEQVQVEYFINNSIVGAQMDPHIAERVFVLYWKTAGRQQASGGISTGGYDDSWSSDYFRYASEWLNHISSGIIIADEQIAAGVNKPYTNNLKQVARIWRAYLMSELADNFGPLPVAAFQGENPTFNSVQEVYYHLLDELKDAQNQIDVSISVPSAITKYDQAYGFNFEKWIRYANSMRMRLAMRLSEVDAAKAKSEFEDAVATNQWISETDHNFSVQELDGWHALAGVMSRSWNAQILSATLSNLYIGLGGIPSEEQLPEITHSSIKADNYLGKRMLSHFSVRSNDPSAGYWFDGLPQNMDPRAYKAFIIPGDFDNPNFFGSKNAANLDFTLPAVSGVTAEIPVNVKYTWNSYTNGNWGPTGARNTIRGQMSAYPILSNIFRVSTNKRIFFANWETNFLIAEAAVRGWAVPMPAKAAYEAGVTASLAYFGVSSFADKYLASTDYNRTGTSVNWDHTTEPPATRPMNYIDGYTNASGTTNFTYPKNTLYQNGNVKNDHLTKIITQKFIAQTPWLPLETWNDHRRLGLPFFENAGVEEPNPNMPALTLNNYMESRIAFFPQRLRYPSTLRNSDPDGYDHAVSLLEGEDNVFTPLWWAKKAD